VAVWNPNWLTNPQETVAFEKVILQRLRVMQQVRIGAQLFHDASINIFSDTPEWLLVRLETHLLADRIDRHTWMEGHPKTWRDHWKQEHWRFVRWWSRWVWNLTRPELKQEFYETIDYATYPFNSYVPPDNKYLGKPVFYRQVNRLTEEQWEKS